jgi:DNA-binding GntR family transcriptional regulator/NAD(P)-dependent dehydrogenase (short-subunit alcohol dehydrogenase family)
MRPVALVTGAAGGVGRATATLLADRGMVVVGADTADGSDLERQLRERDPACLIARADVSSARDVAAVTAEAAKRGTLTTVVNTAAILACHDVVGTAEAEWDRLFEVNVKGTYLVCQAVIPLLRSGGGGCVINVSSVHAMATVKNLAAYAASKGAVLALSRQMALDYCADNIRVVPLVLGSVDTEMSRQHARAQGLVPAPPDLDSRRLGRVAAPAEVARLIAQLASPEAGLITGSPVIADGGMLSMLAIDGGLPRPARHAVPTCAAERVFEAIIGTECLSFTIGRVQELWLRTGKRRSLVARTRSDAAAQDLEGPRLAGPAARTSLGEVVAERLRGAILNAELAPGQHLREEQISELLDVSRGPVRDAFLILESEGLVQLSRHRGATVVELSVEDFGEVYSLRSAIEELAVRLAIRRHDDADLEALERSLGELRSGMRRKIKAQGAAQLDVNFHDCIFRAAHHDRLYKSWSAIRMQVHWFLLLRTVADQEWRDSMTQSHAQILDLIRAGDEATAVAAVGDHILQAYSRICGELVDSQDGLESGRRARLRAESYLLS